MIVSLSAALKSGLRFADIDVPISGLAIDMHECTDCLQLMNNGKGLFDIRHSKATSPNSANKTPIQSKDDFLRLKN
ncbi:hypothetical protein ASG68_14975 [Rhizobium sp. Leaf453]|nr:hypothetical protein ASG50_12855 [Rhizobium sp. Leaf386]KQS88854.1 hypothetical protein ASG42_13795 [Rhizobium sp. Leaf391]KQT92701.1 hypothetical protein ASG68_14975 [Rhizobium sp. Leaf453]